MGHATPSNRGLHGRAANRLRRLRFTAASLWKTDPADLDFVCYGKTVCTFYGVNATLSVHALRGEYSATVRGCGNIHIGGLLDWN
jgi:hypothetical protein